MAAKGSRIYFMFLGPFPTMPLDPHLSGKFDLEILMRKPQKLSHTFSLKPDSQT